MFLPTEGSPKHLPEVSSVSLQDAGFDLIQFSLDWRSHFSGTAGSILASFVQRLVTDTVVDHGQCLPISGRVLFASRAHLLVQGAAVEAMPG